MTYKVFLAWQSQNKKTASYIKNQLDKAAKLLKEQGTTIDVIKSPTQEDAGSPNINEAIWKQIQGVDIFIADLSFVSRVRTSNDNVMYAVAMTTKRIAENYTAEIMKKLIAHGYREELVHLYIIGGGGCLLQNFSDLTAKPEVTVITDICANAKGYEALAMMKQRMRG